MNIPDEVWRKAWADFHATLGSGGVVEADFLRGFRAGAEWADRRVRENTSNADESFIVGDFVYSTLRGETDAARFVSCQVCAAVVPSADVRRHRQSLHEGPR